MNSMIDATVDEPVLPPLLNGIFAENPFGAAVDQVRGRKAGAGDLFWSNNAHIAKIAIVLEPEVDRATSLQMVPLAVVALCDCLAILLPPQVAVQIRGGDDVIVNAGKVGGVRAAISKTNTESEVPDWLVVAIEVAISRRETDPEPGLQPDVTTLDEEGCENTDVVNFIQTFARHFLSWLAGWQDDGFAPVVRAWKFKAEAETEPDMKQIEREISVFESAL